MTETVTTQPAAPLAATREDLLALRHAVPVEPYDLPNRRRVWVHGLKHIEAKQWRAQANRDAKELDGEPDPYGDAKMLIRSVRDAAGKAIFKAGDETLVVELGEIIVQDLLSLCLQVNGLSAEADEGIRKNFARTVTQGS
jgi:hypothetical protein